MMIVYRLEVLDTDGRWTGPYCVTPPSRRMRELRDTMIREHKADPDRWPEPDPYTFARNPGVDRYVSACSSVSALRRWFGPYLDPLLLLGARAAVYSVPPDAVAEVRDLWVVYQQRRAVLVGL